jgi:hypothetical protein
MERQTFEIVIDAPKETVWDILWNEATYPEWTAVFSPGSRAETTWQKGTKALFVDASNEGMVATIAENRPGEFMSIRHLGMVRDGVEDLDSPQVRQWAGALENYTLNTAGGQTRLTVEMDIAKEYQEQFATAWPEALRKVKQLAEQKSASKQASSSA